MVWVIRAEYVEGYKLRLEFSDGSAGVIDLQATITTDHRPIFLELRDPQAFRRFHVNHDTVEWENGLDLAPEYLYELLGTQAAHGRA